MSRRWLLLGLAAVIALAVVGCGGSDAGNPNTLAGLGADGTAPAAAELLPADVEILLSINTDLSSEQWQLATAIANRFPEGQKLIDKALEGLAGEGLDFETEIRPALGADATIAVRDLSAEQPSVAIILQPSDPAALEALLMRAQEQDANGEPVWRVVDGWYVLSENEAALDSWLAAGQDPLNGSGRFDEVMKSLPSESLARVWLSPVIAEAVVARAAAEDPTGLEALESVLGLGTSTFEGAGAAMLAVEEGVRVVGISKTVDAPIAGSGRAEILDLAPAGAFAYISLHDLRKSVEQIIDLALAQQPEAEQGLAQAEAILGLTVENDLLPLFENEHAVYVRAGVPIPEVTVVLSPNEPDAAAGLLRQLVAAARLGGLQVESDTVDIGGQEAELLAFNGVSIYVASVEGHLVMTTAESGIAEFGGPDSLRDDPRFAELTSAAGLPEETAGFVFIDVQRVVELVTAGGLVGAGAAGSVDPEVLRNLDPLGAVIFYATATADEQQFAGLLTIE